MLKKLSNFTPNIHITNSMKFGFKKKKNNLLVAIVRIQYKKNNELGIIYHYDFCIIIWTRNLKFCI